MKEVDGLKRQVAEELRGCVPSRKLEQRGHGAADHLVQLNGDASASTAIRNVCQTLTEMKCKLERGAQDLDKSLQEKAEKTTMLEQLEFRLVEKVELLSDLGEQSKQVPQLHQVLAEKTRMLEQLEFRLVEKVELLSDLGEQSKQLPQLHQVLQDNDLAFRNIQERLSGEREERERSISQFSDQLKAFESRLNEEKKEQAKSVEQMAVLSETLRREIQVKLQELDCRVQSASASLISELSSKHEHHSAEEANENSLALQRMEGRLVDESEQRMTSILALSDQVREVPELRRTVEGMQEFVSGENSERAKAISCLSAQVHCLSETLGLQMQQQLQEIESRLQAWCLTAISENTAVAQQAEELAKSDSTADAVQSFMLQDLQMQLELECRTRSELGSDLSSEVKALAQLIDEEAATRLRSVRELTAMLRQELAEEADLLKSEVNLLRSHVRAEKLSEQRLADSRETADLGGTADSRETADLGGESAKILELQCMIEAERCERAQSLVHVFERLSSLTGEACAEQTQLDFSIPVTSLEERVTEQLRTLRLALDLEAAERVSGDEQIERALTCYRGRCDIDRAKSEEQSAATHCKLQALHGDFTKQVTQLWSGLEVEAGERCSATAIMQERCDELQKSLAAEVDRGLQVIMQIKQQDAFKATGNLLRSAENLLGASVPAKARAGLSPHG
jgi:hypothetical protein